MVERRVCCKHGRHLVVVGRVDVLINTVARELHLQREGRWTHHRSLQGGCKGQEHRPGVPAASHPARDRTCGSHLGHMQR